MAFLAPVLIADLPELAAIIGTAAAGIGSLLAISRLSGAVEEAPKLPRVPQVSETEVAAEREQRSFREKVKSAGKTALKEAGLGAAGGAGFIAVQYIFPQLQQPPQSEYQPPQAQYQEQQAQTTTSGAGTGAISAAGGALAAIAATQLLSSLTATQTITPIIMMIVLFIVMFFMISMLTKLLKEGEK